MWYNRGSTNYVPPNPSYYSPKHTNSQRIMSTLEKINLQSRLIGEKNDCVVRTLAICTKTDYHVARELAKRYGRQYCKRIYGFQHKIYSMFQELGYQAQEVTNQFLPTCKTIRTFERIADPFKIYCVDMTRGGRQYTHIVPIISGIVKDWSQGRCYRILNIWEITKSI